jgi:hypothetical protein
MQMEIIFNRDSSNQNIPIKFKEFQKVIAAPDVELYDGSYEFTPKAEVQIIPTAQKYLAANMIIHKIPEQYGLITYDQDRTITIT